MRTVAALLSLVLAATGPVPYQDSASIGGITFYDQSGKVVTEGSVTEHPFVWKAVSGTRAPAPYDGQGRKATLFAYQPRQEAPRPSDWSGDKMTASTAYDDPAKPTVTAGTQDFSLQDYLETYPVRWDGLVQLRIYFGAPNAPTLTSQYASADIKVEGGRWSVVRVGGGASGQPVADNSDTLPSPGAQESPSIFTDPLAVMLPALGTPGGLFIAAAILVALVLSGRFLVARRRARS